MIGRIFQRARDRGELIGQVEPLAITDLIYGAGLFFVLGRRLDHEQITDEMLSARVADVIAVMIDGLV